jgi:intergrase/recombinase
LGVAPPGGFEPPTTGLTARALTVPGFNSGKPVSSDSHGLTTRKTLEGGGYEDNCLIVTQSLVDEFLEWLKRENPSIRQTTLKDYERYASRLVGLRLCGKGDVYKAFNAMNGLNKRSYETLSRFLTFVEKRLEGYEELAGKLRRAMPKKPKSKEDTYVPPDEKVVEAYRCLERCCGEPYTLFFLVLAYTGLRGTEARYVLENASRLQAVELGYGAVRVHLEPSMQRGSKRAYVAYMPRLLWERVRAYKGKLPHQDTLEDKLRECGLPLKYLRKWWRQKAKQLDIDSETIEAFQGRPRSIGGRHYTDWLPILDREDTKFTTGGATRGFKTISLFATVSPLLIIAMSSPEGAFSFISNNSPKRL